jgi:hypothetical protein
MYYSCTHITIVERKIKYAYEAGVQYRCRGGGFDYGGGHGYGSIRNIMRVNRIFHKNKNNSPSAC